MKKLNKFKNEYGISDLFVGYEVFYICPISNNTNSVIANIHFKPNEYMFDFDEVEMFCKSINGDTMIIEQVGYRIREFMINNYEPLACYVSLVQRSNYRTDPCEIIIGEKY